MSASYTTMYFKFKSQVEQNDISTFTCQSYDSSRSHVNDLQRIIDQKIYTINLKDKTKRKPHLQYNLTFKISLTRNDKHS